MNHRGGPEPAFPAGPVHQELSISLQAVGKPVGWSWMGSRQLDLQPPSPPQRIFFLVLFLLEVLQWTI